MWVLAPVCWPGVVRAVVKPAGLTAGFWPGRFINCKFVSERVYVCVVVGKPLPGCEKGSSERSSVVRHSGYWKE